MSPQHLEAGQCWVPTVGRTKSRIIRWVGPHPYPHLRDHTDTVGWVHNPDNPTFRGTNHDSWMLISSFRRWIRDSQAQLKTREHYAIEDIDDA